MTGAETEKKMRDAYISVPLPGEHFHPNVRLLLHNRGGVEDPYSFVHPIFGEEDALDTDWILQSEIMKDLLAQKVKARPRGRTLDVTIRDIAQHGDLPFYHLSGLNMGTREECFRDLSHAYQVSGRDGEGRVVKKFFPKKPTKAEVESFFTENGVDLSSHRKLPQANKRALRPLHIEPIADRLLKRLAERETKTVPVRVEKIHTHNQHAGHWRRGDVYLAIVGPEVRDANIAGIKPEAVAIVDIEALCGVLMDLDVWIQISRGRKQILASSWWKSWYAENSNAVGAPPAMELETEEEEETADEADVEDDTEAAVGPGGSPTLAAPMADQLAAKTPH